MKRTLIAVATFLVTASITAQLPAAEADLILHHGKVVTVDRKFSIAQAVAIRDGRIVRVGDNDSVLKLKDALTKLVDLAGRTVLPGLIDSHTHPTGASMTEFDHEIPAMETIGDVLAYVRERAAKAQPGEWINLSQVFITRLRRRFCLGRFRRSDSIEKPRMDTNEH